MTNFMPNVNTEAKQKRLMDLVREQDNKQYAIVQFVNENEQDIFSALKEAVKRGLVDDNYDEDDDGKSIDLADAFMRGLREWREACNRSTHLMATGEDISDSDAATNWI